MNSQPSNPPPGFDPRKWTFLERLRVVLDAHENHQHELDDFLTAEGIDRVILEQFRQEAAARLKFDKAGRGSRKNRRSQR